MEQKIQTGPVTKEMTIGDVVQKYPKTADVMLSYGLHCIGCHVNPFEAIEGGAKGHGMSDDDIDTMINEMNAVVAEQEKSEGSGTVSITEVAANKLKELMKSDGKKGYGFRVSVVPGGCAGLNYEMDFAEKAEDNDEIFESYGVKVFVDRESMKHIGGTEIDYADSLNGGGFKIRNPNAKSNCGCGNSFS